MKEMVRISKVALSFVVLGRLLNHAAYTYVYTLHVQRHFLTFSTQVSHLTFSHSVELSWVGCGKILFLRAVETQWRNARWSTNEMQSEMYVFENKKYLYSNIRHSIEIARESEGKRQRGRKRVLEFHSISFNSLACTMYNVECRV